MNFISVNGGACKKPKVTAKMINAIAHQIKEKQCKRAGNCDHSAQSASHSAKSATVLPALVQDPSHSFGLPTRPSTPLMELIQNKYGKQGEEKTLQRYQTYSAEQLSQSKIQMRVRKTKSSEGHAMKIKEARKKESISEKELFKLTKFKKVPSRIHLHQKTSIKPESNNEYLCLDILVSFRFLNRLLVSLR